MKPYTLTPVLLAFALTTACAAPAVPTTPSAKAGEQVRMDGRLALKGSMPLLQAVLTLDTGERWELKDVQPYVAGRLQNKRVAVEGRVVRPAATPMLLPSLAVTRITLKQ